MDVGLIWDGGRESVHHCSGFGGHLSLEKSRVVRTVSTQPQFSSPSISSLAHLKIAVAPCFQLVEAPYGIFVPSEVMCPLVAMPHPSLREGYWRPH